MEGDHFELAGRFLHTRLMFECLMLTASHCLSPLLRPFSVSNSHTSPCCLGGESGTPGSPPALRVSTPCCNPLPCQGASVVWWAVVFWGGLFSQEGLSTSPLSPHVPDPQMDLRPHTLTRHVHTRSLQSCCSFKRSLERGQWRELTTRAPLLTELDEFTK